MTSNPNPNALTTLTALLDADPALERALRQATSIEQFMQQAAQSAKQQGVALDIQTLRDALQRELSQTTAPGQPGIDLDEEQLASVAGGYSGVTNIIYTVSALLGMLQSSRSRPTQLLNQ